MPFLGSKNGHELCQVRIQEYLEKQERAIARDFVNLNTPDEQRAWGYHMDNTRSIAGNDADWCGKRAIMYKHFMISPDPRDQISLEKLRELTMRWVHEFFGDDVDSGKLGSYQVAVIYHDDNTHHIPHAHVIVNNTNLDTGYRLQIDNKTNEHTLPDRLQEIAASEEFNLSYFTNDSSEEKAVTEYKRFYTKAERSMIRQGRFVWKSDLADRIDIARRTNTTADGFKTTLGSLGVDVEDRDDDYLYVHQSNPERWKAYGYRIGADYSKKAIASSLERSKKDNLLRDEQIERNVVNRVMTQFLEEVEVGARTTGSVSAHDVAITLKVIDEYDIRSIGDAQKVLAEEMRRARVSSHTNDEIYYKRRAEDLQIAIETMKSGTFFDGVDLSKKPASVNRAFVLKSAGGDARPTSKHKGARSLKERYSANRKSSHGKKSSDNRRDSGSKKNSSGKKGGRKTNRSNKDKR